MLGNTPDFSPAYTTGGSPLQHEFLQSLRGAMTPRTPGLGGTPTARSTFLSYKLQCGVGTSLGSVEEMVRALESEPIQMRSACDTDRLLQSAFCDRDLIEEQLRQKSLLDDIYDAGNGKIWKIAQFSMFPSDCKGSFQHRTRSGDKLQEISEWLQDYKRVDSLPEMLVKGSSPANPSFFLDLCAGPGTWSDWLLDEIEFLDQRRLDDELPFSFTFDRSPESLSEEDREAMLAASRLPGPSCYGFGISLSISDLTSMRDTRFWSLAREVTDRHNFESITGVNKSGNLYCAKNLRVMKEKIVQRVAEIQEHCAAALYAPHETTALGGREPCASSPSALRKTFHRKSGNNGLIRLIVADGGITIPKKSVTGQHLDNYQELLTGRLLLSEILIAFQLLEHGGTFVCTVFDVFSSFTASLLYLCAALFEEVHIVKPSRNRWTNSERQLVGLRFRRCPSVSLASVLAAVAEANAKPPLLSCAPSSDAALCARRPPESVSTMSSFFALPRKRAPAGAVASRVSRVCSAAVAKLAQAHEALSEATSPTNYYTVLPETLLRRAFFMADALFVESYRQMCGELCRLQCISLQQTYAKYQELQRNPAQLSELRQRQRTLERCMTALKDSAALASMSAASTVGRSGGQSLYGGISGGDTPSPVYGGSGERTRRAAAIDIAMFSPVSNPFAARFAVEGEMRSRQLKREKSEDCDEREGNDRERRGEARRGGNWRDDTTEKETPRLEEEERWRSTPVKAEPAWQEKKSDSQPTHTTAHAGDRREAQAPQRRGRHAHDTGKAPEPPHTSASGWPSVVAAKPGTQRSGPLRSEACTPQPEPCIYTAGTQTSRGGPPFSTDTDSLALEPAQAGSSATGPGCDNATASASRRETGEDISPAQLQKRSPCEAWDVGKRDGRPSQGAEAPEGSRGELEAAAVTKKGGAEEAKSSDGVETARVTSIDADVLLLIEAPEANAEDSDFYEEGGSRPPTPNSILLSPHLGSDGAALAPSRRRASVLRAGSQVRNQETAGMAGVRATGSESTPTFSLPAEFQTPSNTDGGPARQDAGDEAAGGRRDIGATVNREAHDDTLQRILTLSEEADEENAAQTAASLIESVLGYEMEMPEDVGEEATASRLREQEKKTLFNAMMESTRAYGDAPPPHGERDETEHDSLACAKGVVVRPAGGLAQPAALHGKRTAAKPARPPPQSEAPRLLPSLEAASRSPPCQAHAATKQDDPVDSERAEERVRTGEDGASRPSTAEGQPLAGRATDALDVPEEEKTGEEATNHKAEVKDKPANGAGGATHPASTPSQNAGRRSEGRGGRKAPVPPSASSLSPSAVRAEGAKQTRARKSSGRRKVANRVLLTLHDQMQEQAQHSPVERWRAVLPAAAKRGAAKKRRPCGLKAQTPALETHIAETVAHAASPAPNKGTAVHASCEAERAEGRRVALSCKHTGIEEDGVSTVSTLPTETIDVAISVTVDETP
ncbi:ribosomal RNA large subunit methyltransferase J protein [Besnoitia besnoiti]|uniref:Cap-specific mRNA (nucleoside-2'-O-)-methyltransferase 1 n=1 Tax=Besnoitia besnoiti TaxID=94643 RepID=A0A2A9M8G1_BESBE|nr:ribosomal RNA large subunit methyltransferase J protein [Besnoitia besnoiti]PFH34768.1 ribosomal RNA large subunit methyltransferase J protein [Besnoitia besnoiti]